MRLVVTLICATIAFGQKQPFDVQTMLKLSRLSEPVLSPDARLVAFTVQTVDLDRNTKPKQISVVGVNGSLPRQLTVMGTDNERPRWSPDSRQIYFVSNRDGSSQIWSMSPDGGSIRQISHLSSEAGGILISPDGKKIVFTSNVYPQCGADDACNKDTLDAENKSK